MLAERYRQALLFIDRGQARGLARLIRRARTTSLAGRLILTSLASSTVEVRSILGCGDHDIEHIVLLRDGRSCIAQYHRLLSARGGERASARSILSDNATSRTMPTIVPNIYIEPLSFNATQPPEWRDQVSTVSLRIIEATDSLIREPEPADSLVSVSAARSIPCVHRPHLRSTRTHWQ